ncbi:hypothetical protein ACLB2K_017275 [Fragaria x ananassa]
MVSLRGIMGKVRNFFISATNGAGAGAGVRSRTTWMTSAAALKTTFILWQRCVHTSGVDKKEMMREMELVRMRKTMWSWKLTRMEMRKVCSPYPLLNPSPLFRILQFLWYMRASPRTYSTKSITNISSNTANYSCGIKGFSTSKLEAWLQVSNQSWLCIACGTACFAALSLHCSQSQYACY